MIFPLVSWKCCLPTRYTDWYLSQEAVEISSLGGEAGRNQTPVPIDLYIACATSFAIIIWQARRNYLAIYGCVPKLLCALL